ncbi:MAG: ABC transporter substrate-binding protein [Spirochaetaceae bacterium]|jgi:peptide/nickel transport system substrate-binding protein|nr:ABC transporter substrate-binding protein [Spirochaetaceae bacterium]
MKIKFAIFFVVTGALCLLLPACSKAEPPAASAGTGNSTPYVRAIDSMNGVFSPFFGSSAYDSAVVDMALGDGLLTSDRLGNIVYNAGVAEGETIAYNGRDYPYNGIASVKVETADPDNDGKVDSTSYTWTLRKGIRFSDGEEMTADDIIFTAYVYLDPSYTGSATINSLGILGYDDYKTGKADFVSGIEKLDDYTVQFTIQGINTAAIYRMAFQPAPLHYYGSKSAYNYDAKQFGFSKGDLSSVKAKDSSPMGAGPYKFIEFKDKIVYFEANPYYWRGEAKTKYVQFKETAEPDKITAITTGAADYSEPTNSKQRLAEISGYNSNKQPTGDKLTYKSVDFLGYGYIGINASLVRVGTEDGSRASRNLRKAFGTIFAVYRELTIDSYYGDTASAIEYPISKTSWAAPRPTDPGYEIAYSKDVNGKDIYTSGMSADQRYAAAEQAALGYFAAAGYSIVDGKLAAAPAGARLDYKVMIAASGTGEHPSFMLLTKAAESLKKIGMNLTVQDIAEASTLFNAYQNGTTDMWVAAWSATLDPDMYQLYASDNVIGKGTGSNFYMIADPTLDTYMQETRSSLDNNYRREIFQEAYRLIMDWAVEIPVYQRQEAMLLSTERVDVDSITDPPGGEMTTFYGMRIDLLRMKAE